MSSLPTPDSDHERSVWGPPAADRPLAPPPVAPPVGSAPGSAVAPAERPRRSWLRRLGVTVALIALAVGSGVVGALVGQRLDQDPRPPQRASGVAIDVGAPRDGALPPIDVATVAEYIAPSVVTIISDIALRGVTTGGIGTGVITTSDGEILTNAHVVEGASEIRVRLAGESEPRSATLVAADSNNDLALLRVAGDDFVPATFAEPGSVRIGDEVVAIGFALNLDGDPSVTRGIVSALDRTFSADDKYLDGLLQTDAAISSGNSGGPLVNTLGEVVGINTAVARNGPSVAATNIGFAISVDEALPVIERLRNQDGGTVREEGYLGVGLEDRRDGGQGAMITEVQPGTPADDAGIESDDIVIAVGDKTIDGSAGMIAAIRDRLPGDDVDITVLRNGETLTITITLTTRPDG